MVFRTLTLLCTVITILVFISVTGEGYAVDEEKLDETWDRVKKSPSSSRTGRHICPPPYSLIAGLCLYSPTYDIPGYCSWEAARQHCLSYDGDLASFRHLKNLILVMGHMRATQRHERWVGGWRSNSSVEFEWLDGGSLPDTNSTLWDYRDHSNFNCLSFVGRGNLLKLENFDCDKVKRCAMWCQFK